MEGKNEREKKKERMKGGEYPACVAGTQPSTCDFRAMLLSPCGDLYELATPHPR